MARIDFKLSTMVGENFENYTFQMARMAFKLSTMVGENFENYTSQMARMTFKFRVPVPPFLKEGASQISERPKRRGLGKFSQKGGKNRKGGGSQKRRGLRNFQPLKVENLKKN